MSSLYGPQTSDIQSSSRALSHWLTLNDFSEMARCQTKCFHLNLKIESYKSLEMQTWKHLTDIGSGSKHQMKANWCICRLQLPVCSLWWFCVIHVDTLACEMGYKEFREQLIRLQPITWHVFFRLNFVQIQESSVSPYTPLSSSQLTFHLSLPQCLSLSFSFLHLPSSSSAERRNSHLWFCHVSTIFILLFSFFLFQSLIFYIVKMISLMSSLIFMMSKGGLWGRPVVTFLWKSIWIAAISQQHQRQKQEGPFQQVP